MRCTGAAGTDIMASGNFFLGFLRARDENAAMRTVWVTGGHMTALLNEQGYRVIVADYLCTGHARAVAGIPLWDGDLRDSAFLNRLFQEEPIDSVIDFTACLQVSESMRDPLKYYENNLPCMISFMCGTWRRRTFLCWSIWSAAEKGEILDAARRESPAFPFKLKNSGEQAISMLFAVGCLLWFGLSASTLLLGVREEIDAASRFFCDCCFLARLPSRL